MQHQAVQVILAAHNGARVGSIRRAEVIVRRLRDLEVREDNLAGTPVFTERVAEVACGGSLLEVGDVVVREGGA